MRMFAIFCLAGYFFVASSPVQGFQGELLAEFDYQVSRFLMHPDRPIMYASAPSTNSVLVVDTTNLQLIASPFVGSNPGGMAISNDGLRLYVANTSSNFVAVVDTETNTLIDSLAVPELARDVEVGWDGRLYVLGDDSLMQLDPVTGSAVGPNIGTTFMVYSGEIAISPDKQRLYYADYGLSPASLYQFDVTADTAVLLWESPHGGTSGSNGQDLAISHDGTFVSYACGYGQGGYIIAKYRTSDMLIEGTFDCGAYPREITFSPDDAFAYTVHTSGGIDVWDTTTFVLTDTMSVSGEANELQVDASRRYLFAAFDSQMRIYGTGRSVVPPASVTVQAGYQYGGTLASYAESDDDWAIFKNGLVSEGAQMPVSLEFFANAPFATELSVESNAGTPGLTYWVEMWNYSNGSFEVLGTKNESFNSDVISTYSVSESHIDENGDVRARIGWQATGPTINYPWEVRIDQVTWSN